MRHRQLRLFLALADEMNLTRAAAREGVSASGMSRVIRQLESELRIPLFVRHSTGVSLTPAGTRAVEQARGLVGAFDELERVVRAEAAQHRPLAVGITFSVPPLLVDLTVRVLREHLADEALVTDTGSSAELMDGLVAGGLDLAVVYLPVTSPSLRSLVLLREPRMLVVRSDDELAGRSRLSWSDLRGRRMVLVPRRMHPEAVDVVRALLVGAGALSHEAPDADSARVASLVQRDGSVFMITPPRHGGGNTVFLDPAFALVPFDAQEAEFPLALVWPAHTGLDVRHPGLLARLVRGFAEL